MTIDPAQRLARLAVGWYPLAWRERYAEEVLDVLDQHQVSMRTVGNLVMNAAATRLDPAYRQSSRLFKVLKLSGYVLGVTGLLFVAGPWILAHLEPTEFGVIGAHDVSYSADSRLVLAISGDSEFRMWNLADPAHPVELCSFRGGGDNVSLSPDGRTIAALDGSVVLWDVSDPAHPVKAAALFDPKTVPEAAVFSPDGRTLATSYHETIILFDVSDPAHPIQLTPLPAQLKKVPSQAFSTMRFAPGGQALATTGGGAHEVTLWDIADPAHPTARGVLPLLQGDPPAKYTPLAFTPDGAILAATEPTGLVTLWNVADLGHPSRISTVDTTATQGGRMGLVDNSVELVIPPGGHTLITVMNNQKASLWDIADPSHPRHVGDVIHKDAGPGIFRTSPDGHTVVSAARPYRDTINVWTIPAD